MVQEMKLWRISQDVNRDYDTFDSAVVVAPDEETARRIHPKGAWGVTPKPHDSTWAAPEHVGVAYLGEAVDFLVEGQVIVASFNAG